MPHVTRAEQIRERVERLIGEMTNLARLKARRRRAVVIGSPEEFESELG